MESITTPAINSRVSSVTGDKHGSVVEIEQPYMTMDQLLYTIRWDDGLIAKIYCEEFVALGPFETLAEFQNAIRQSADAAKLTLGPNGGFRDFEMAVQYDGAVLSARYGTRDGWVYRQYIQPCLQNAPDLVQLKRARSVKRSK